MYTNLKKCKRINKDAINDNGSIYNTALLKGYGVDSSVISDDKLPTLKQLEILDFIYKKLGVRSNDIKSQRDAWIFINTWYDKAKAL